MNKFFREILDGNNSTSAKRFITLLMASHLIVTSFLVSFFTFYLMLHNPKGTVNVTLISLLQNILDSDLYIVLAGLGIIGAESIVNILVERAKALAGSVSSTVSSITAGSSGSTATTTVINNKPDAPQTEEGA